MDPNPLHTSASEGAAGARASVTKRLPHLVAFEQMVRRELEAVSELTELRMLLLEIRTLVHEVNGISWKLMAKANWTHPKKVGTVFISNTRLTEGANAAVRVLYTQSTLDGMKKILEEAREQLKVALDLDRKVNPRVRRRRTRDISSDL